MTSEGISKTTLVHQITIVKQLEKLKQLKESRRVKQSIECCNGKRKASRRVSRIPVKHIVQQSKKTSLTARKTMQLEESIN